MSSRASRTKPVRVAILLSLLLAVGAWARDTQHWREQRREWQQTLRVDLLLLEHGAVSSRSVAALQQGAPRLAQTLHREFQRYRPGAIVPFEFIVHDSVPIETLPPEPPSEQDLVTRASYYLSLRAYFRDVHARARVSIPRRSVPVYVVLEPTQTRVRFAEGFGVSEGDFGVVHTAIDERTVDQALIAIAHELAHCFGATDKYDPAGHAVVPAGLAEPDRSPTFPQRYGELMVGEVPLDPMRGRLIASLAELRVGPITAVEIGWVR